MIPKINPTNTQSWKNLSNLYEKKGKNLSMSEMFINEGDRFEKFHLQLGDVIFDYSKNLIDSEILNELISLAKECKLEEAIEEMFSGEKINETEDRAVLHTALRNFSQKEILVDGENIVPLIEAERNKIKGFCSKIHSGSWKGYSGKPIKTIVNIGIGGSDLGPLMVCEALKPYWVNGIQVFFVNNIDASSLLEVYDKIDVQDTLFVVASKTFTTQETLTNANTARELFLNVCKDESQIKKHFVAVTTNIDAATHFGIDSENIFQLWDWVGGRYSLWGSVGLPIALTVGFENFEELLRGAELTDNQFKNEKLEINIPVIMALLSVWYTNFHNTSSEVIIAYDNYLNKLTAYLQQACMESNGKSVDRNGNFVNYKTGSVIWGEPGTNAQHSFFQLIHQGTEMIPCDFIIAAQSHNSHIDHHQKLVSNFLAQTEALMVGKSKDQVFNELSSKGMSDEQINKVVNFKVFKGNKPSNSIVLKKLNPFNLGCLIAMYEHKIFVQGVIWNIFSFDQWGVELGKELANQKLLAIKNKDAIFADNFSKGLIDQYTKWN
jgi:glucose-6-phosphate isomerase